MQMSWAIFFMCTLAYSIAFIPVRKTTSAIRIYMSDNAVAEALPKNLPRKLKRGLRTITAENFDKVYNADFENFLIKTATPELNEKLLFKIKKTARKLGLSVKEGFGEKPAIVYNDIVDTAVAAGTFNTLVTAVQAAGLVDTLKATGPLTVFAPSEEAFAKLPAGTIEGLLADIPKLTEILSFHVLPAQYKSKKIARMNGEKIETVAGKPVTIKVDKKDGTVTIDGTKITTPDIKCSNGLIHVIDTVLMPK